jgi:predicted transcriptional regulator
MDFKGRSAVSSQQFPWVFTKIAKMPKVQISRLAEEYLHKDRQFSKGYDKADTAFRNKTLDNCRLLIRLLTEMQLRCVVAIARVVQQDCLAGNALVGLLAENWRAGTHSLQGGHLGDTRPITIRAMARSFHRPYETMRRALRRLHELELIDFDEDGVILRDDITERPEIKALLVEMHDIMVTLLDDVFIFAKSPLPNFPRGSDPADALILAALDLHLLGAEALNSLIADWTGLLVLSAITAGNTRDITYHPELAFTYASAESVPPMHLRQPVYFKNLCEALPICPTTAWRRITVMKMLGAVKTVDGGLINDSKWFTNAKVIAGICNMVDRMNFIICKIPLGGIKAFNPQDFYINGRVDRVIL